MLFDFVHISLQMILYADVQINRNTAFYKLVLGLFTYKSPTSQANYFCFISISLYFIGIWLFLYILHAVLVLFL